MTIPPDHGAALARAPLLREIGEALYGDRWQASAARELRVSKRTVQRWAEGRYAVPESALVGLSNALLGREAEIALLLKRLAATL